jgi:hypothetical protein
MLMHVGTLQVLVMAHKKKEEKTHKGSLPKSLSDVQSVSTTLEDNHAIIKDQFDRSTCTCARNPKP